LIPHRSGLKKERKGFATKIFIISVKRDKCTWVMARVFGQGARVLMMGKNNVKGR
jgi:hypothetical protein